MSPLTQGLNYRSACDRNVLNLTVKRHPEVDAVYLFIDVLAVTSGVRICKQISGE